MAYRPEYQKIGVTRMDPASLQNPLAAYLQQRGLMDPSSLQRTATGPGPSGLAALLQRPGLKDALFATGMALLAQKDQPGSLGGALGRALPVGMQAYQQGQQEYQQKQQETAQAKQNEMFQKAVGDPAVLAQLPASIRALIPLLPPQQVMELVQKATPNRFINTGFNGNIFDASKGEFVAPPQNDTKPTESVNWQQRSGLNPETGKKEIYFFNPRTQEVQWPGIIDPGLSMGDPGYEDYRMNLEKRLSDLMVSRSEQRALLSQAGKKDVRAWQQATAANNDLRSLDKELTDVFAYAASQPGSIVPLIANFFASEKGQQANTAAKGFINPVVRFLSGAQMNASEADRYWQTFIPRPGDQPEAIAHKARMRELMVNAMDLGMFKAGSSTDGKPDIANLDAAVEYIKQQAGSNDPYEVGR